MLANLGIGIPTQVANYVPAGLRVFFQSENGLIGTGAVPEEGMHHRLLTDAGGRPVTALPGACTFDSAMSFGLIRGGHLDMTVLGGLQIDESGHLANWKVPGKMVPGMGGAMDLVTGAARVVVAMQHSAKGQSKIVARCTLPLTALRRVDLVVTDLAVIEPTGMGLILRRSSLDTNSLQVNALRDYLVEMSEDYPRLALPVEIVHGTEDRLVPPDVHAIPLSKLIPGAVLTLLPGVGHMPHHADPEAVVAAIDRAAARAGLR
jgi:acetate CoA/acetoacetate CoA-transferase beta subunit